MKFEDLKFGPHVAYRDGIHAFIYFDNGYGASVIKTPGSYGGTAGHYELAVLLASGDDWCLTYETPITDDVLGWLSEKDVIENLVKIKKLPSKNNSTGYLDCDKIMRGDEYD